MCAVDSVQTLHSDAVEGAPGAPNQVRQVTVELMRVAKERGVTILLVGQVTKDGGLAGPRTLEHLVDCVLSFEGDDLRAHRVLRATKNRFGSTNETGVFEMGARRARVGRRPHPPLPGRGRRAGRLVRLPGHRGQPRAAGRGAGAGRAPPRSCRRGGSPIGRRPHAPGPGHRRALAARRAAARRRRRLRERRRRRAGHRPRGRPGDRAGRGERPSRRARSPPGRRRSGSSASRARCARRATPCAGSPPRPATESRRRSCRPGAPGRTPASPAPPVLRAVPGVQEALDAAFAR